MIVVDSSPMSSSGLIRGFWKLIYNVKLILACNFELHIVLGLLCWTRREVGIVYRWRERELSYIHKHTLHPSIQRKELDLLYDFCWFISNDLEQTDTEFLKANFQCQVNLRM